MTSHFDIVIVGGGFSGLMVAANLVRQSKNPLKIFWAGAPTADGLGIAYGTQELCHLLNVRAGNMSAWADKEHDFINWLNEKYPQQFKADQFVSRRIYGEYLNSIRDSAILSGSIVTGTNAAINARYHDDQWEITLDDGHHVKSNALVLATGNPVSKQESWPQTESYVQDFWAYRAAGGSLNVGDDQTIVIAGAGLTMADVALSCLADEFKGKILAVSPHGHMPEVHADTSAYKHIAPIIEDMKKRRTASHYFKTFRRYAHGDNWRAVIDGLRPHLVKLWQFLPDREKARFMRHLWSRWNIRRHRMAPSIAATLSSHPQIEVMAGRIIKTDADGTVTVRPRGSSGTMVVKAAKVINCTGPSYRQMLKDNKILAGMERQDLIEPGPLSLGIKEPQEENLYALGTLLLGERLETTAVPELRQQAAEIAQRLISKNR